MEGPLRELLKANGTPLKMKTARTFLKEVERVAPWFLEEGLLNIPQREHLGEDLRHDPEVSAGHLAVWSLVKLCLQSKREPVREVINQGEEVLEQVKEESRRESLRSSNIDSESSEGLSEDELEDIATQEKVKGEENLKEGEVRKVLAQLREKKEELEKVMAQLKLKEEVGNKPDTMASSPGPTAPPYEWPPPYRPTCSGACRYPACMAENGREVLGPGKCFFPVMEDQNQQRYHQPLDFKLVKQLKEAVMQYAPQAAFTISLVEAVGSLYLTPEDWGNLAKAVLSGGEYLEWKIQNQDNCQETARRNAAAGNHQWNLDMFTGTGLYLGSQAQSQYLPGVYHQIAAAATRAWRTLRGAGDLQGQLSKVLKGPNEPYTDFVDRLMQRAGRVFQDVDMAMPLVKQLAFENANKWCRGAIRPWKAKDLSVYIKVCRDISGQVIQGQVMAAAFAQALQGTGARPKGCFLCGQGGHLKRKS
ncbi:igE-binding protein-like [Mustela nigripes]|uniref:igE-binding protein-like n=1 Tax=Mustela nigripes TaxID=77151 RepID=UPI002814E83C|nr:igE-binding protein-like [Mustela nigripes]